MGYSAPRGTVDILPGQSEKWIKLEEMLKTSIDELENAIKRANIVMLPGGFSAGDEPEGSGKFIATVLRNPRLKAAISDLLDNRDGLFLIKTSSTLAPAFSKARFESYSQFVPGNTGITTNGVSIYCFAFKVDLVLHSATLISCVGAFSLVG